MSVVALVLGFMAPTAASAEPARPMFQGLVAAPDPARDDMVLAVGRLVVPGTGTAVPVSGVRLMVFCDGLGGTEGMTDAQGRFRMALWVPHTTTCEAVSDATAEHSSARSTVRNVRNTFDVRIAVTGGAPRLRPWQTATVNARVQRREVGGWVDAPYGTWVGLYENGSGDPNQRHVGSVFHPGPGGFTTRVTSHGFGPLTAQVQGHHRHDGATGTIAHGQWSTAFHGPWPPMTPAYPHFGRKYTVSARLMNARFSLGGIPGVPLELQAGPMNGEGPWKTIRRATTGKDGSVRITLTANKRQDLRFVFRGNAAYAPARPKVMSVWTTYQTKIFKYNAAPEPARKGQWITLRGRLMRWTQASGWRPIKSRWISGAYRVKGGTRWEDNCVNGGAPTDSQGWFRLRCRVSKDATWRVYSLWEYAVPHPRSLDFPAQAYDYVDVR
ncbi:hypothetical protein [Thermomonospora umbrina]|uniref:hypothetical protein n=1 Tax=Thermomonospora umbrina TaxID=111806 RepID=UPI000E22B0E8|nr:hypothetical protein [Thermomonospora umbrina]